MSDSHRDLTSKSKSKASNPLAPLVADSLVDDEKFYELWGVAEGAKNYPIWNFFVSTALYDPERFNEDNLAGLLLEAKYRFDYLNGNENIANWKKIDELFKKYESLKQSQTKIMTDIDRLVSIEIILSRIQDDYFETEVMEDDQHFAFIVIALLEKIYNTLPPRKTDQRELIKRVLEKYRNKLSDNEEEVFFKREKAAWIIQEGPADKYTIEMYNNFLFLLQHIYIFNMNKFPPSGKNEKLLNEFYTANGGGSSIDKLHEMMVGLHRLSSSITKSKINVSEIPLPTEKITVYAKEQPKKIDRIPNVFERFWNAIKKFAEENPLLTGFIIVTVLAAIAIGITISTGGAGAVAGAAVFALGAAHLPAAAAFIAGIAAISTAAAVAVDVAIVAVLAYASYALAVGLSALGGFLKDKFFGEPEITDRKTNDKRDSSEASASRSEDTATFEEKDLSKGRVLTRSESVGDLSRPKMEVEKRERSKSVGDRAVLQEGLFPPRKKEAGADALKEDKKEDDRESEGLGRGKKK